MTRKDFEFIAATLRAATPIAKDGDDAMTMWKVVAIRFAQRLETTNPRFNKARFLAACGLGA